MSEEEAGGAAAPDQGATSSDTDKNARTWGMITHLSTLSGALIPFGNIIAPLIIWQVKKTEIPSIETHGKEALNFQISMTIYLLIAAVLCLVFIGVLLIPVLAILDIIFVIVAGLKANEGKPYQYPMSIRLIK